MAIAFYFFNNTTSPRRRARPTTGHRSPLSRRTAPPWRTARGRAASAPPAPARGRPRRSACRAARPSCRSARGETAYIAATPKRVASTRSNADGGAAALHVAEDRDARLIAGALLDLVLERDADPAEPRVPEGVGGGRRRDASAASPRAGWRPRRRRRSRSCARAAWRRRRCAHTSSTSNGRSGTRIASAPPAIPACVAIQPAWRPITSTTITRLWDSAVVCRRSIASVTICTAVWKPNVTSVPPRSLSIVFGTPTIGMPSSCRRSATPSVSSPPIGISASTPRRSSVARIACRPPIAVVGERVGARGAEDRAAAREDADGALQVELDRLVLEHPRPAVAKPHEAVLAAREPAAHGGADHGVQPGAVPAAGEQTYARHRHRLVWPAASPQVSVARRPITRRG